MKLVVLGQRAANSSIYAARATNSSICVPQEPPTVAFWCQRGPSKQAFPPIAQCLVMISEPSVTKQRELRIHSIVISFLPSPGLAKQRRTY